MKLKQIFFISILMIFFLGSNYAQSLSIYHQITTFDSIPVRNATIEIIGTSQIYKSDSLGFFKLPNEFSGKIKISAKGFISRKEKINSMSKSLKFNLISKNGKRANQLAVDSGHISDKEKFYAAVKYAKENPDYSSYANVLDIIKGRFPGVTVEGDRVIIRGKSSIFGATGALIEVDGIVMNKDIVNTLQPGEIKSIRILKGNQLTLYGGRGANGVVAIKTKKGTSK
ncbi:TonB-dependent receptor plug domain-containing protein [Ancylomarina longa]|uniref:TonB-dependent receptor plug domain-containing protein n=1 Tax=Ancylomarina longa TaxID=2487017 RepID=A0A434AX70_9BACT|nr:TonB-dependent receptor plug domain-containing protein [Ancylomarina longa]RUT79026.1 hypothetical protein DLK05_05990 [Ancylomarina longa]